MLGCGEAEVLVSGSAWLQNWTCGCRSAGVELGCGTAGTLNWENMRLLGGGHREVMGWRAEGRAVGLKACVWVGMQRCGAVRGAASGLRQRRPPPAGDTGCGYRCQAGLRGSTPPAARQCGAGMKGRGCRAPPGAAPLVPPVRDACDIPLLWGLTGCRAASSLSSSNGYFPACLSPSLAVAAA